MTVPICLLAVAGMAATLVAPLLAGITALLLWLCFGERHPWVSVAAIGFSAGMVLAGVVRLGLMADARLPF